MPHIIYHLVWKDDWEREAMEVYAPPSLAIEGFIHATREPEKLLDVAGLFFSHRRDPLLVVELDVDGLESPVRYEDPGVGHLFPHIYGPINLSSVRSIHAMRWSDDGWGLPDSLHR